MQRERAVLLLTAATALFIGVGLSGDSRAFYGDPRFYASQPAVTNRVVHNAPGFSPSEEYIVTNPAGTPILKISSTVGAVSDWNNELRNPPNSITKYVFHYNGVADPAANVIVNFISDEDYKSRCGLAGDACNDKGYPTTNVWVKSSQASKALVAHELGHSLWYSDQYNADYTCSLADTIMNVSGPSCKTAITATDMNDFQQRYKPSYQSADATWFNTWGATWNAVYQAGSATASFPNSWVEYKYYWEQRSDTGGTLLASAYNAADYGAAQQFTFGLGSRYCILDKIYNEVGYSGTDPWSPRSQYSCVGAAQVQNAGFLLATSDRSSPSSNPLYIRIKNFAGWPRNVGIFGVPGPGQFVDIGCGYMFLGDLQTRACYVPVGRAAFPQLGWYAWDGNILSWGYLDFE